jgi:DNA-binding response OmpR family regulator
MGATGSKQATSVKGRYCPVAKVLIVDQELSDLEFYASVLRSQGFHVQVCTSYEEGLCHLNAEPFDMVVVDQGSPQFEGKCVLERSIEKNRHLPVLVVARCHDMHCYLDAMQLGAVDYLAEPVAASDLQWVVDTHVRTSAPMGAEAQPGVQE